MCYRRPEDTVGWPIDWYEDKYTLVRSSLAGSPYWGTTFRNDALVQSHYAIFWGPAKIAAGIGRLAEMEIVDDKPLIKVQTITTPNGVHYVEPLSISVPSRRSYPDVEGPHADSLYSDAPMLHTQYLFSGDIIDQSRWLELSQQVQKEVELRNGRRSQMLDASGLQARASLVFPWWAGCLLPKRRIHLFHGDDDKVVLPGLYRQVLRVFMKGQTIFCDVMEDRYTFSRLQFTQC